MLKIHKSAPVAYENIDLFDDVKLKVEPQLDSFVLPVCIKAIHVGTDNYFNVCLNGEKIQFTYKQNGLIEFNTLTSAKKFMNELKNQSNDVWSFEIWSVNALLGV